MDVLLSIKCVITTPDVVGANEFYGTFSCDNVLDNSR